MQHITFVRDPYAYSSLIVKLTFYQKPLETELINEVLKRFGGDEIDHDIADNVIVAISPFKLHSVRLLSPTHSNNTFLITSTFFSKIQTKILEIESIEYPVYLSNLLDN